MKGWRHVHLIGWLLLPVEFLIARLTYRRSTAGAKGSRREAATDGDRQLQRLVRPEVAKPAESLTALVVRL
jgi:hypothetical protein